jgi:hypothetical protein
VARSISASQPYIYPLFIAAVTLIWKMTRRRATFSLLSAAFLVSVLTSCGSAGKGRPDLPDSVSPGWKRASFEPVSPPFPIPAGEAPEQCWKASYIAQGTADAWVCRYRVEASAFNTVQRAPAEAQAVKFQEGNYFVLVKWNAVPKADLTTLMRAIQKSLTR